MQQFISYRTAKLGFGKNQFSILAQRNRLGCVLFDFRVESIHHRLQQSCRQAELRELLVSFPRFFIVLLTNVIVGQCDQILRTSR